MDRNYVSSLTVKTILECVYGLLLNPDVTDPLDTGLAFSFYEGSGQYEAKIIAHRMLYAAKSRQAWKVELS